MSLFLSQPMNQFPVDPHSNKPRSRHSSHSDKHDHQSHSNKDEHKSTSKEERSSHKTNESSESKKKNTEQKAEKENAAAEKDKKSAVTGKQTKTNETASCKNSSYKTAPTAATSSTTASSGKSSDVAGSARKEGKADGLKSASEKSTTWEVVFPSNELAKNMTWFQFNDKKNLKGSKHKKKYRILPAKCQWRQPLLQLLARTASWRITKFQGILKYYRANLVVCSTSFHRSDGFYPETIMLWLHWRYSIN